MRHECNFHSSILCSQGMLSSVTIQLEFKHSQLNVLSLSHARLQLQGQFAKEFVILRRKLRPRTSI